MGMSSPGKAFCRGPLPRREFLRAGALALGGLTLSELLAARAAAGKGAADTTVILFWMWGGPSQLETWDLKPQAPSEYRGPFQPIATTVPGMEICELFPLQARQAHRFSLIRSLHHEMAAHNDGSIELLTGKTPSQPDPTSTAFSEHPDFGMIASRARGTRADGLPQYVGIPRQPFMTRPQYLGASHAAFATGDPSAKTYAPPNLTLSAGVDGSRLGDRRHLVSQFDRLRRDLDLHGTLHGIDAFRAQALEMLVNPSIATAFDMSQESDSTRDRYGRHLWGQSCLLARRLAEAGTAVITIDALAPTLSDRYFSWDDHINPTTRWDLVDAMRYRAPFMDQGLSALIDDLFTRGLDRKVLVVACGEFGRTPRLVNYSGLTGRDHWPQAMSALISGGGLQMGQVIGATNSKAEYPSEQPLTPRDLLATMYRHLGVDPQIELADFFGRPVRILSDGDPIRGLI
jgi:hypothetical protein